MSSEGTKKLFSVEQVFRVLTGMFLIGAAWARLEYKTDSANAAMLAVFEKYVIQNEADKKMMKYQYDALAKQVEVNELTIRTIANYLKPDEAGLRDKR